MEKEDYRNFELKLSITNQKYENAEDEFVFINWSYECMIKFKGNFQSFWYCHVIILYKATPQRKNA